MFTLAVQMNDSVERKACFRCIQSKSALVLFPSAGADVDDLLGSSSIDPPFGITGGIFRKEAIMLLRKFYFQENNRGNRGGYLPICFPFAIPLTTQFCFAAPQPRSKKNRQLNTEFEEDVEVVSEKKRRTNTAKDTSIQ